MPASRRQRATILAPRSWPSSPTLATSTRIGLCAITPPSPRPPPSYLGSAAAACPPLGSAWPGGRRGETARKCLSQPPKSGETLQAVFYRSELSRADAPGIVRTGERQARRIVSALLDQNVLISDSTRAPLRLAFPAALAPRWMPGLFPDRTGRRPKRPRDPAQLATLIGVARLAHPPR